jgi:DNA-binding protein YbaB
MRLSIAAAALVLALGSANAFAPIAVARHAQSTISTQPLHLFGGGGNKGGSGDGGAKKDPGMMDQLSMFKRAAEMAQKKQKLDTELAAETFEGVGADGKVKALCKFVPSKNPMDPQPEFETASFEFDDEWYETVTPEALSAAVMEALKDGTEKTSLAMAEKYKALEDDLRAVMGGALPPS